MKPQVAKSLHRTQIDEREHSLLARGYKAVPAGSDFRPGQFRRYKVGELYAIAWVATDDEALPDEVEERSKIPVRPEADESPASLRALVTRALREADNDTSEAAEILVELALEAKLLDELAEEGAKALVSRSAPFVPTGGVSRYQQPSRPAAPAHGDRLRMALRQSLLERREVLLGNLRLGNARRSDLQAGSLRADSAAAQLHLKARFFEEIAKRLPDDTTCVRDVLTEDDLQQLQETHDGD